MRNLPEHYNYHEFITCNKQYFNIFALLKN